MVIDARIKPHHAPPVVMDESVNRKVDRLFAKGGSLAGIER
jgi:4-hydroxy-3-polyprenylbenzoate decarboxylase